MKAKVINGQAPGGKRTPLAKILPLKTPFVVQIFPIYACNFKCNYCIFSVNVKDRGFISDKISLDLNLYKKCIDEMTKFPDKIKTLRFVGIGEPLLHKKIIEMIKYASSKNIANTIELLTNASLLNKEMTDQLINSGLTRMVVSAQGTKKEKYKDICGFDLNFDEFIVNLKYFYENKKNIQLYIKIVDSALDDAQDEQRFYEIFGNICDTIAIEHTVPIHTGINYENVLREKEDELTQFGLPVTDVNICPQPFFTMQINPDGKIVPCYSFEYPQIIGDCNNESIFDIWNGEKFKTFRRKMLDGIENVSSVCKECNIIKYRIFPDDRLNADAERLKKLFE